MPPQKTLVNVLASRTKSSNRMNSCNITATIRPPAESVKNF
jgi:hypothetical protein